MWYLSAGATYYWAPTGTHWDTSDYGWVSITGAGGPKGTINPWTYNNSDFTNPGNINFAWKEGTHDGANGHTFYVVTKAVDATTNAQVILATRTFRFDNVPPNSAPFTPGVDTAYRTLPAGLAGTSVDAVTTVASVDVSILSENEPGGPKYFNPVDGFTSGTEFWVPVDAQFLYPSSWTYTHNALITALTDTRHYVVKSSATDSIGNRQSGRAGQVPF